MEETKINWSTYEYPKLEEDFEEHIRDQLEYEYVDNGIGPYEFWGSKECQVKMEWELQTHEVTIYVELDSDPYLPLQITGDWSDDNDGDQPWKATLDSATWESSPLSEKENRYRHYKCVYSVEENH